MMDIYKASKKRLEIGQASDINKSKFVWIDCKDPSAHDIEFLAKLLKLRKIDIIEYLEKNQRPKAVIFHNQSLILVKTINNKRNVIFPLAIFISDKFVVTLRRKDTEVVERVLNMPHDVLSEYFTPAKLVYRIIDEINESYFIALDRLEDMLDAMEMNLFKEKPDLIRNIFNAKKGLIYIHKALTANREVVSNIERLYVPQIRKPLADDFRHIFHEINQMTDMEESYRDIITGILDTHLSQISNNMNKVMKKLTAGGALILVPTLISGIYGMNFKFMPELMWPFGYVFALGLMVVSVILLWIYFKRKHYF